MKNQHKLKRIKNIYATANEEPPEIEANQEHLRDCN